ncbi:EP300-interacting inhibitor of differentiation 3-like [Neocloeon triangulifer]|uniref:EP300-interacting inhibitor of differentiation 3-like n=1 Tax=Neocloeon triangulifer TaxID=2078957 RepID=UPI00286F7255|nr:EP300-interacting inhibitor of differentiation 3-like [Neocloeon triangulifer]
MAPNATSTFVHWNNFLELIDEAKAFLLKAEEGEMCLDQLKSLSDRGMAILVEVEDKKLQMIMLDINLMDVLFKIFQLNVRTLSPERFVFDPVTHAHKILHVLREKKESRQLGDILIRSFSEAGAKLLSYKAPSLSVMAGAFDISDPEKKARAAAVRHPKDKIEAAKAPEKVTAVTGRTVDETVVEIGKQLKSAFIKNERAPISYIKFAFNPESFTKTVENIFHIAFLVNLGQVNIFLDKEQRPWIKPIEKENQTKNRDKQSALVMGITQDEWKEAIRLFEVTEPMIKLNEREIAGITHIPTAQKRRRTKT